MNGKRAKRLRRLVKDLLDEEGIAPAPGHGGKIKVGRAHGGPAFGRHPYPASRRIERIGGFDVWVTSTDALRNLASEVVESDYAKFDG